MMRSVSARLLTAGLLVLVASTAFAQPPGGRMRTPPSAASLLRSEKVQTELKLTDDQKAQITKITDKYKDDIATARTNQDFAKRAELTKSMNADLEKALPDLLKADQTKRLNQLLVQVSGLDAFAKDAVKSALKLTDAQTKTIDDQKAEIQKDSEDLLKDVGTDRAKRREAFTKIQAMRTDALTKVLAGFTDDQKKAWTDLTGDKFEFDFGRGQRRPRTNNQ